MIAKVKNLEPEYATSTSSSSSSSSDYGSSSSSCASAEMSLSSSSSCGCTPIKKVRRTNKGKGKVKANAKKKKSTNNKSKGKYNSKKNKSKGKYNSKKNKSKGKSKAKGKAKGKDKSKGKAKGKDKSKGKAKGKDKSKGKNSGGDRGNSKGKAKGKAKGKGKGKGSNSAKWKGEYSFSSSSSSDDGWSSTSAGPTDDGGFVTNWIPGRPGMYLPAAPSKFEIIGPQDQNAFTVLSKTLGQLCSELNVDDLTMVIFENIGGPARYVFAATLFSPNIVYTAKVDLDSGKCFLMRRSSSGMAPGVGSWQTRFLSAGENNDLESVSSADVVAGLNAVEALFANASIRHVYVQPMAIGNPGLDSADYYNCQSINLHVTNELGNEFKCTYTAGTGKTDHVNVGSTRWYAGAEFTTCPCVVFSDQDPHLATMGYTGNDNDLKSIYNSIIALPNRLTDYQGSKPGWGYRFLDVVQVEEETA